MKGLPPQAAASPPPSPPSRQLHPLPRGLVELYGLLAVLVVLVPEWLAGGALAGLRSHRRGALLPPTASAWQHLPELRLAVLSLADLRQLARQLRLADYASQPRDQLTARLLRRLGGGRGLRPVLPRLGRRSQGRPGQGRSGLGRAL